MSREFIFFIKKTAFAVNFNWCRRPGSNRYGIISHGILSPGRLPVPPLRQDKNGGGTRTRTGGIGVADLCLTTWPCRREQLARTPKPSQGSIPLRERILLKNGAKDGKTTASRLRVLALQLRTFGLKTCRRACFLYAQTLSGFDSLTGARTSKKMERKTGKQPLRACACSLYSFAHLG